MAYVSRMRQYYLDEVIPALQQRFGYRNIMEVPRLNKIVLNMGLGEAIQNAKLLDGGVEQLAIISGQKPIITKARKSIAAYKLREGMSIGCLFRPRSPISGRQQNNKLSNTADFTRNSK